MKGTFEMGSAAASAAPVGALADRNVATHRKVFGEAPVLPAVALIHRPNALQNEMAANLSLDP